jgi:predicted signal transduction protein with EAL and GGDEF domain
VDSDYVSKADRVRDRLRNEKIGEIYLDLRTGAYPVSYGESSPRHGVDRACYAMNFLKKSGDNHINVYDENLHKQYKLRQYVLNNIDKAVLNGYIQVYYQPVMWAKDGTLCGFEALARWIDPAIGFLSPGQFVPILEEIRQIHKLDRCVYESVCRQMRNCIDKNLPVLPTSINFSRLDFELMDAVGELENL